MTRWYPTHSVCIKQGNDFLVLTRRERLLKLICFIGVSDAQCVEIATASDLELRHSSSLLDLHRSGILTPSRKEELLDFLNLFWLRNW